METKHDGPPQYKGCPIYTSRQLGNIISLITGEPDRFWIANRILSIAKSNAMDIRDTRRGGSWIRLGDLPVILKDSGIKSLDGTPINLESIELVGRYLAYYK